MGTILENTTQVFADGDQITSTNLNNLLSEATFKSTAVDQSSVTLSGGKIALPSTIPTRTFTSPTLSSPTISGTLTVNSSSLAGTAIVLESEGIGSNDNDTTLPTSAAVKDYVDTKITAEDLDFADGIGGTGAVDLDSQTLTIAGTANEVETSASGQTLTIGLPSTITANVTSTGTSTFSSIDVNGGSIDGTTVGASSASTGAFTTLTASDDVNFDSGTLFVDASADRVGIGTTSPSHKLHLSEASADFAALIANSTSSGNGLKINAGDNSGDRILQLNDKDGNEKMRVGATGLVGIGTASPGQKLEVNGGNIEIDSTGGVDSRIIFSRGGTNLAWMGIPNWDEDALYIYGPDAGGTTSDQVFSYTQDTLKLKTNGSDALTIDSSQNVGIGTTSPDHKLSVFGDSSGNRTEIGIDNIDQRLVLGAYFETGVTQYSTIQATNNAESSGTNLVLQPDGGNVGIGTSSPSGELHVNNASSASDVYISSETTSDAIIALQTNTGGSAREARIGYDYSASLLKLVTGSGFSGSTNGINIDTSGNVGIGTTSPNAKLQIKTSASEVEGISVLNAGNTSEIFKVIEDGSNGGYVDIRNSSNTTIIRLDSSGDSYFNGGNVGIGTASPSYELDVAGDIRATGALRDSAGDAGTSGQILSSTGTGTNWIDNTGGSSQWVTTGSDIYYNTGNVGIKTASPSAALDITGELELSSHATLGSNLYLKRDTDAWTTSATWLNVSDFGVINTGGSFALTLNGNGYRSNDGDWTSFGNNSLNGATQIWQYPAGYITFNTNSSWATGSGTTVTERVRIDSSGNIGVNDSSPSYKLDVNGTGRFVSDLRLDDELIHNLSGSGSFPGYSAGTFGAVLEDGGSNGSTLYMSRKNLWALYLATDTTLNSQGDKVVVFADLNGQSGNQDNVVGDITITSSSTAYNTSSDYRLKENEVDISDGIDRLKQLKPYRFNFKQDADTTVDGFFAHEVSDVVPEAITGTKDAMKDQEYEVSPAVYEDVVHPAVEATYDEDGNELTPAVEEWTESVLVTEAVTGTRSVPDYQGIDQSKLVPLLTAALQEAVAKIEALEARVATLEG